ncbi:helix-turn-helix domain-containing protein [Dryocola sp. LX212]|jgi:CRP-like cAMP-binding protein
MCDVPSLSTQQITLSKSECRYFLETISQHGKEIFLKPREFLIIRPQQIYFVNDGQLCTLIRAGEATHIIDYAFHLMPIGITENLYPDTKVRYRATTDVNLIQISESDFYSLFKHESIDFVKILLVLKSTTLVSFFNAYRERCTASAYCTIKSLIEHYHHEPKQLEGLSTYILHRTHLSRGYVFRVLARLRNMGVLTMEDGRLISVNADLPLSI